MKLETHTRPGDGKVCSYFATAFCNKCGWANDDDMAQNLVAASIIQEEAFIIAGHIHERLTPGLVAGVDDE